MGGACECGEEPSGSINAGNFLTSCKLASFSRRTLLHGVSKEGRYFNIPHEEIEYTQIK